MPVLNVHSRDFDALMAAAVYTVRDPCTCRCAVGDVCAPVCDACRVAARASAPPLYTDAVEHTPWKEADCASSQRALLVDVTEWALRTTGCTDGVVDTPAVRRAVAGVARKYSCTPAYHNAAHAADVTQALAWMLARGMGDAARRSSLPLPLVAATILGAAGHDAAHPGVSNAYMCAKHAPLAVRYNDVSPLENMHACTTWGVLWPCVREVFPACTPGQAGVIRTASIRCILGTDNEYNARHLAVLQQEGDKPGGAQAPQWGTQGVGGLADPSACLGLGPAALSVLPALMHVADLVSATRCWAVHQRWALRIAEEFRAEGDRRGIDGAFSCVPDFMDRHRAAAFPEQQGKFVRNMVLPLATACARIPWMDPAAAAGATVKANAEAWERIARELPPSPRSPVHTRIARGSEAGGEGGGYTEREGPVAGILPKSDVKGAAYVA